MSYAKHKSLSIDLFLGDPQPTQNTLKSSQSVSQESDLPIRIGFDQLGQRK